MTHDWELLCNGRLLPGDVRKVLQNLSDLFGPELCVTAIDGEGITLHVAGLTAESLIRRMEIEQHKIFGRDLAKFQILCPLGRQPGRGIFIRPLDDWKKWAEYAWGFWYY